MAKRKQPRSKKGSVSVTIRNGMLLLRWRHLNKRPQLSLGLADNPLNQHKARGIAARIEADLLTGHYDPSLEKYQIGNRQQQPSAAPSTVELFEQFTAKKRLEGVSGQAITTKYHALRSNIARYGEDITSPDQARQLVNMLRARQSPLTSNQNLVLLKSFGEWLLKQHHIEENIFKPIRPLKSSHTSVQDRTPFTKEELLLFLETMRIHPTGYQYYDFTIVLFLLGLRPSEAIGLRWCHVNLDRKEVIIRESLSRAADGRSSGRARQRKDTKTGKTRVLPLNERLLMLFAGRKTANAKPDDLIFTTPTGKPIDDRMFRERYWRRICESAGIPYRPPYAARHTFISHGIEYKRWTPHQAASMAGHSSTRMVSEVYGHMMDMPELPDF
jgi:integrase